MTLDELNAFAKENDWPTDAPLILAADGEGNDFARTDEAQLGAYAETRVGVAVFYGAFILKDTKPAIILWPRDELFALSNDAGEHGS